ncbi:MAG: addiction module antitoxin [Rhodospirillales bacterium]|nr:MAG: addiction module antitoxin [Rhodospirillales bacterium]
MKKLTISVSEEFYAGLQRSVGRRRIGNFLEKIARPHVIPQDLAAAYRDMAADETREEEAMEWAEATTRDLAHEAR